MKTTLSCFAVLVACAIVQIRASAAQDPLDTWRQADATGTLPASAICYGGGKWLGLDAHEHLVSSTNGLHWEISRTFSDGESPGDLDYANSVWVLLGAQSTNIFVLTSEDGETWDRAILPTVPPDEGGWLPYSKKLWRGGGEWVVRVGYHWVLRSTNGHDWALSPLGSPPAGRIRDLTYGEDRWVAQVETELPGSNHPFSYSTNLVDWEWWKPWPAGHEGENFERLKYFNGVWFCVSRPMYHDGLDFNQLSRVLTSTDATDWIVRHVGSGLRELSIINGRAIAISFTQSGVCCASSSLMWTSDPLISLQLATRGTLKVQRAAGMPIIVERTEDFHTWQMLTNLPFGQPVETVTDSTNGITKRFYRAHSP